MDGALLMSAPARWTYERIDSYRPTIPRPENDISLFPTEFRLPDRSGKSRRGGSPPNPKASRRTHKADRYSNAFCTLRESPHKKYRLGFQKRCRSPTPDARCRIPHNQPSKRSVSTFEIHSKTGLPHCESSTAYSIHCKIHHYR